MRHPAAAPHPQSAAQFATPVRENSPWPAGFDSDTKSPPTPPAITAKAPINQPAAQEPPKCPWNPHRPRVAAPSLNPVPSTTGHLAHPRRARRRPRQKTSRRDPTPEWCSITSAYSTTSPPADPGCQISSLPTTVTTYRINNEFSCTYFITGKRGLTTTPNSNRKSKIENPSHPAFLIRLIPFPLNSYTYAKISAIAW